MCIMRFDPTPLYRSTVGFDKLFNMLNNAAGHEAATPSYPPYNIERLDEDNYRITMAVAGFEDDEISIEVTGNSLNIQGQHDNKENEEDAFEILHRGIASRNFERRFQLENHVHVTGAELKNGLLYIMLERVIPEEKKTRKIPISFTAKAQRADEEDVETLSDASSIAAEQADIEYADDTKEASNIKKAGKTKETKAGLVTKTKAA